MHWKPIQWLDMEEWRGKLGRVVNEMPVTSYPKDKQNKTSPAVMYLIHPSHQPTTRSGQTDKSESLRSPPSACVRTCHRACWEQENLLSSSLLISPLPLSSIHSHLSIHPINLSTHLYPLFPSHTRQDVCPRWYREQGCRVSITIISSAPDRQSWRSPARAPGEAFADISINSQSKKSFMGMPGFVVDFLSTSSPFCTH